MCFLLIYYNVCLYYKISPRCFIFTQHHRVADVINYASEKEKPGPDRVIISLRADLLNLSQSKMTSILSSNYCCPNHQNSLINCPSHNQCSWHHAMILIFSFSVLHLIVRCQLSTDLFTFWYAWRKQKLQSKNLSTLNYEQSRYKVQMW